MSRSDGEIIVILYRLQERKKSIAVDDRRLWSSIVDPGSPDEGKYLYLYVPCTMREQNYRCLTRKDTRKDTVWSVCVRTEYREEKPSMYAHTYDNLVCTMYKLRVYIHIHTTLPPPPP